MLRAIVFDFDGVIANSEPLHYQAFRDVLAESAQAFSEQEYYARYLGFDDLGVFRTVMADRGLDCSNARLAELVARKAARLEVLERDVSIILFPGAEAAIRRAAAAVPLAIVSGALGVEIRRTLERERLLGCFAAIVAAEDTVSSKPAPDPYLRALALLAGTGRPVAAADCVAIEDSPWGLQSARAAGLRTVAVAQTYDASVLDADLVISTTASLDLAAIERLCSR